LSSEFEVRSQASHAYRSIRNWIIECTIPPLAKLKINDLAGQLSVSPGAVREALSRLTTEQLVEARDQQGFRASAITLEDLDDLTRTRVQIEGLAIAQSIALGDEAWKRAVRRAHDELHDHRGPFDDNGRRLHRVFHETLVAGCGSPSLLRIRRSLYELSERYRCFAVKAGDPGRDVVREHEAIAAAALAGFGEAASRAMAEHIRITARIIRTALAAGDDTNAAEKIYFPDDNPALRD
jgi:DNA-binding GntR family transcriptional regulator